MNVMKNSSALSRFAKSTSVLISERYIKNLLTTISVWVYGEFILLRLDVGACYRNW